MESYLLWSARSDYRTLGFVKADVVALIGRQHHRSGPLKIAKCNNIDLSNQDSRDSAGKSFCGFTCCTLYVYHVNSDRCQTHARDMDLTSIIVGTFHPKFTNSGPDSVVLGHGESDMTSCRTNAFSAAKEAVLDHLADPSTLSLSISGFSAAATCLLTQRFPESS